MAEEAPVIQNKRLLAVATVLAAVVVTLFYVQLNRARRSAETVTVKLAVYDHRMKAGDRIKLGDLKYVEFPEEHLKRLPKVLKWEQRSIAKDKILTQPVQEGEFVSFQHIVGAGASLPSNVITEGMTTYIVTMNREDAPGDILQPNSRVNLVGIFSVGGKTSARLILEKARVVTVGGRGPRETVGFQPDSTAVGRYNRTYTTVSIEVPPKIELQLRNLRTHAQGNFWVQVLNPNEIPEGEIEINPELTSLAMTARPGRR